MWRWFCLILWIGCAGAHGAACKDEHLKSLRGDLAKAGPGTSWQVDQLVRLLSHESWSIRHATQQRLEDLPVEAVAAVSEHYRNSDNAEAHWRIERYAETLFRQRLLGHYIEAVSQPAFLGVSHVPGRIDDRQGVYVTNVLPDTAAQRAGIQPHDVIVALDGMPLNTADPAGSFLAAIQNRTPGTKTRIKLVRNGQEIELIATLGQMPEAYREPHHDFIERRIDHLYRMWWEHAFLKGRLHIPTEVLSKDRAMLAKPLENEPPAPQAIYGPRVIIETQVMPMPVPRK